MAIRIRVGYAGRNQGEDLWRKTLGMQKWNHGEEDMDSVGESIRRCSTTKKGAALYVVKRRNYTLIIPIQQTKCVRFCAITATAFWDIPERTLQFYGLE
jgi:hypothetical protein